MFFLFFCVRFCVGFFVVDLFGVSLRSCSIASRIGFGGRCGGRGGVEGGGLCPTTAPRMRFTSFQPRARFGDNLRTLVWMFFFFRDGEGVLSFYNYKQYGFRCFCRGLFSKGSESVHFQSVETPTVGISRVLSVHWGHSHGRNYNFRNFHSCDNKKKVRSAETCLSWEPRATGVHVFLFVLACMKFRCMYAIFLECRKVKD